VDGGSFFESGPSPDESYLFFRDDDSPRALEGRAVLEELWSRTAVFLDPNFRRQARESLLSRFWEMYLASALTRAGSPLAPRAGRDSSGPDFRTAGDGIWIEATIATAGDGADAVPELVRGGVASAVPDAEIKLRLRAALLEKLRRHQRYVENGVVQNSEPYVVAINGAGIRGIVPEHQIPRVVRVLFPVGDQVVRLAGPRADGIEVTYLDHIKKRSGASVSTDVFLSPEYSGISAVIYGCCDVLNHPPTPSAGLLIVHNPLAENPIAEGRFLLGSEYTWKDNQIVRT